MLMSHLKPLSLSIVLSMAVSCPAFAQDGFAQDNTADNAANDLVLAGGQIDAAAPKKRINRVVEPIPYWVEADRLRIRSAPETGDVVGMLKAGQKVQVRQTEGDWMLISVSENDARWVERSYLSAAPVTWTAYQFDSRQARNLRQGSFSEATYDRQKKRIKIKDLKNVRVYAADIMRLTDGQKIIVSRHDFRAGVYYEKRMVQCTDDGASHIKMLGEGYTVKMMNADPRLQRIGVPMSEQDIIAGEGISKTAKAIAEFTCATDTL